MEKSDLPEKDKVKSRLRTKHTKPKAKTSLNLLCDALLERRSKSIRELAAAGCNINRSGPMGLCPLHIAARNGDACSVRTLLECGADSTIATRLMRWTPLHFAAHNRHPHIIAMLCTEQSERVDVNAPDVYGHSPLFYSVIQGDLEAVRIWIAVGADLNMLSFKERTPLLMAARYGRAEAARLLLEAGARASLNISQATGETPLHLAAHFGHSHLVMMLLQHGADVFKRSYAGADALAYAAMKWRLDIVIDLYLSQLASINEVHGKKRPRLGCCH